MLLRIFTTLLAFGGLVGAIPVPDEAHVDEGLLSLKSRQTGHQEYFINLDEKSQMFWLELAYGDAFFTQPITSLATGLGAFGRSRLPRSPWQMPSSILQWLQFGEAIGNIVEEWVEAFKWQKASPKPKTEGDFKTPIYGRSFWSEDPGWSVNIEECGNTPIDFGQDVLHDT
ncbi:hypothetical protein TWF751_007118 [Orbilia oligospora]|nr:hypothetical protein TWF751_007118 [Orbilia oligospora]